METSYVDIEGMSTTLEEILSYIENLKEHIEGYETSAEQSLGESSFREVVEENLKGIKYKYEEMIPEINRIKEKIEKIIEDYNLKANQIIQTYNN